MSSNRSAKPPKPTLPAPQAVPPETTAVFLKPCFGITVQSCTLCVSVSARPDSGQPCPPTCG